MDSEKLKRKLDPSQFMAWSKERSPYGKIAILEGIRDILRKIAEVVRG